MNYILTTKTEAELYHHGVKGMKWGVIRWKNKRYDKKIAKQKNKEKLLKEKEKLKVKKEKLNSLKSSNETRKSNLKNKSYETDKQELDKPRQKTVKELSDTELKNRVNRLNLEQQYMQYTKNDVSKGKQIVNEIMSKVVIPAVEEQGKVIIKDLINSQYQKKKTK